MSTWTDLCLPCPTVQGYGYQSDAGLLRTPMDDGSTRQRRRWLTLPQTFSLRWVVKATTLQTLLEALDACGYDWFELPLTTGNAGPSGLTTHTVRLTGDVDVALISGSVYAVTAPAQSEATT